MTVTFAELLRRNQPVHTPEGDELRDFRRATGCQRPTVSYDCAQPGEVWQRLYAYDDDIVEIEEVP